ncbi:MAG: group II intron reverse transcriptase/maturase [Acidobacteriota bacterium]
MDRKRRFHALYDKIERRDVLERAWFQVRSNRGAPGIDRIAFADVEQEGVDRWLDELASDLKAHRWRPLPARRVWIPKPGGVEQRPLSIPTIRDRVVQAAAKIVLEPVFEADMAPNSFGFRPKRTAHDALQVLTDESWRGRRWVVETDIASCFEAIPHDRLMRLIEDRVSDRNVLKLLRVMLRAGVMEHGTVRHSVAGTPQGGVISPLMCNVYLNPLDQIWAQHHQDGVLVRYADDLVVMCSSRRSAEYALRTLRRLLGDLGLELREDKTRIVHLGVGEKGFDFLGFHLKWIAGRRQYSHLEYLARWPSRKATRRARDRIRDLTGRSRLPVKVDCIVADVNRFLRGWTGYFRYGNSAVAFDKIHAYAKMRLALFVSKRHDRSRSFGWSMLYGSPNLLGLLSLNGIVVAPRPNRSWREKPHVAR